MNRALQPELHPDAESLSAFMERALPEPERVRILDHIGVCGRCRQIIYLAQQASDAEEDAVSAARVAAVRNSWRWNWRRTWAPAAALVGIFAVAAVARLWRAPQGSELAKNITPTRQAPPAALPQSPVKEAASSSLAPAVKVKSAKKSAARPAAPKTTWEMASNGASSHAIRGKNYAVTPVSSKSAPAAESAGAFGQGFSANAASTPQPEPAVAAWEQEREAVAIALQSAAEAPNTSQARFSAKTARAETSRSLAGTRGRRAEPTLAGSLEPPAPQAMAALMAVPRPDGATLPSGLGALSMATAHGRSVAIDPAGTLFVRESLNAGWKTVARQWTGRLVQVRLRPAVEGGETANAGATSSEGSFEIVNDSSMVWASLDGEAWQPE